ncbi:hypothetical protein [Dactylosporangium sp. NPDC051541]|uniref:DUF7144 family membrane protein n=1 Tax=Dactylosporangium sp. NPDC051541 TaxID=3363977 RepID=UPI0037B8BF35
MRVKEFRTFGTSLLTLVGALNVAQGLLVAYAGDAVGFNRNDVAFTSAGTWAVATVTLGVLLVATGLALRARRPSAKAATVAVVALHAISQLAMLRAYPAWSLLMVTLDVILLFILTVPRGSVVAADDADEPQPARPAPPARMGPAARAAKLTLRRNSRSDAYHGRHKAGGRTHVRHSVSRDDIITIDLLPPEVVAASQDDTVVVTASVGAPMNAALAQETIEAELVGDTPTVWVRAVGQATVPTDAHVPVQRSSLESLDPLIDPLPLVLAEEAAIAAEAVYDNDESGELAAIGARPYVNLHR